MTTTISGSNGVVFPDLTTMQTGQQAVKAWVNFNGTGTVAIRAAYNVSSLVDNGTGNYTVNFTTAMPDVNYAAVATGHDDTVGGAGNQATTVVAYTTTSIQVALSGSTVSIDSLYMNVAIFR